MVIRRQSNNPFFGVLVVLVLFVMIWLAISAVRGIFMILSWLALPLFVLALILNYRVVTDYFKWLWRLLRQETVKGIIYTGLTLLAYPFVSAYLAMKAFNNNRWSENNPDEEVDGEYIKYKEVEIVDEEDDFLELEDLDEMKENPRRSNDSNAYDDMF